jgi:hypothetical protein
LTAYLIKGSTSITAGQVTHEHQQLPIPREVQDVVGVRGQRTDGSRVLLSHTFCLWKQ